MQANECLPLPCSGNNHLAPTDILTDLIQTSVPNGRPNLNGLQHNQRATLSCSSLGKTISVKVFTKTQPNRLHKMQDWRNYKTKFSLLNICLKFLQTRHCIISYLVSQKPSRGCKITNGPSILSASKKKTIKTSIQWKFNLPNK